MMPVRSLLLIGGLALLGGCSRGPTAEQAAPEYALFQDVNGLLRASGGPSGRPPAKLEDLNKSKAMYPRAYDAVKSGAVVVLWNPALKGEGEVGQNEAVVAYEKAAPTEGGYVLLSAGTVRKMTADEFNRTPKAGKQ